MVSIQCKGVQSLKQILFIPKHFSFNKEIKKNGPQEAGGGGPKFCQLGANAKFHDPRTTNSGRTIMVGERKKERRKIPKTSWG